MSHVVILAVDHVIFIAKRSYSNIFLFLRYCSELASLQGNVTVNYFRCDFKLGSAIFPFAEISNGPDIFAESFRYKEGGINDNFRHPSEFLGEHPSHRRSDNDIDSLGLDKAF